jgi:putative transcriptional regulator
MMIPKDDFSKLVGQKISVYREKRGLSQAELARRCNKDRQAIERLEKGRVNPNSYTLYEISQALKINTKNLLDF